MLTKKKLLTKFKPQNFATALLLLDLVFCYLILRNLSIHKTTMSSSSRYASILPVSSSGLKAVAVNDSTLPEDSEEYVDPNSNFDKFYSNLKYKTISAGLKLPLLGGYLNKRLTLKAGGSGGNRPYEYSCKADYTSYESLTDYSVSSIGYYNYLLR